MTGYDSTTATMAHISRVQELLTRVLAIIEDASFSHDASKLLHPEKEAFDVITPKLSAATFGSDTYKKTLAEMKPSLDHHYSVNRHHPEHFENGISGMTLIDILEMLCDWKASSERHANGDITRSIRLCSDRFAISEQLSQILLNTAECLGWVENQNGRDGQ